MVAIVLIASLVSNAQTDTTLLTYDVDMFTKKEKLRATFPLFVISPLDSSKGLGIFPYIKKINGIWSYAGILGIARSMGTCYEKDKLEIIFEDGSLVSENSFVAHNCVGNLGFDQYGKLYNKLNKLIKAVRFTNGISGQQITKVLTEDTDKKYFINIFKAINTFNKK